MVFSTFENIWSFKSRVTPQEGQEGGIPLVCGQPRWHQGVLYFGNATLWGITWHKNIWFYLFFHFLGDTWWGRWVKKKVGIWSISFLNRLPLVHKILRSLAPPNTTKMFLEIFTWSKAHHLSTKGRIPITWKFKGNLRGLKNLWVVILLPRFKSIRLIKN